MNDVKFDGKWTFFGEWKKSSLNTLQYPDGTVVQLRTAHQDNYIYVLVDVVSENQYQSHGDFSIICFDKDYTKTEIANSNDYCIGVSLDNNNAFVLQGGSELGVTGNFKKITNTDGVIGISSISDNNDHYTTIPHPSYEFRIPIDMIGRSDHYGFYLGIYDSHVKKIYTFPENLTSTFQLFIPSPSKWGEMISPDKSLPEFPLPYITFLTAFIVLVFIIKPTILRTNKIN
jgi:hypothetical protein